MSHKVCSLKIEAVLVEHDMEVADDLQNYTIETDSKKVHDNERSHVISNTSILPNYTLLDIACILQPRFINSFEVCFNEF